MFEIALSVLEKKSKEQFKVSKGLALLVVLGAFLLGIIMGAVFGCGHTRKAIKMKRNKNALDAADFDADAYVRSLNFEEEYD